MPKRRKRRSSSRGSLSVAGTDSTAKVTSDVERFLAKLFEQIPAQVATQDEFYTYTVIFEFSSATTLTYHVQTDGWISGWKCSAATLGISLTSVESTLPNGGANQIHLGQIYSDGLGANVATTITPKDCRFPIKIGDIISVKTQSAGCLVTMFLCGKAIVATS